MTDAILEVLKASPSPWMTSKAIREQVSERMGRAVPKTSISPKLSELKAKGRIVRDDLLVALPERAAQTGERSLFGEGS